MRTIFGDWWRTIYRARRVKDAPDNQGMHVQHGTGYQVPVRVLSVDPPVFLTGIPHDEHLGFARAWAEAHGNEPAGFVVFPTWTLERAGFPEAVRNRLEEHTKAFPAHRFRFICNSDRETQLLGDLGLQATFLNKNFMVSERIFKPIAGVPVEFDAIYNARFTKGKRHELAALVPTVGYVTYVDGSPGSEEEFSDLLAKTLARNPAHRLINKRGKKRPSALSPTQVNEAQARAAVGLLLSAAEGSSYASMEYMLAGMPVVSTPSIGGRDVYFDPEYCTICEATPEAVREAVAELRSRNLDRSYVRERTLARVRPERERLLRLVDDLTHELGGAPRVWRGWEFGAISGVKWDRSASHLAAFHQARERVNFAREAGLSDDDFARLDMTPGEMVPVMRAIRETPGCRLLVFGTASQLAVWEATNRGGTTVLIEDGASGDVAGPPSAAVRAVRYTTVRARWRELLDDEDALALDLPEEITAARWDVILVDGPAGYKDDTPGRMQSIFAASQLATGGTRVFVHDVERMVEEAYAERFLGRKRMFVEVSGMAKLRGYQF